MKNVPDPRTSQVPNRAGNQETCSGHAVAVVPGLLVVPGLFASISPARVRLILHLLGLAFLLAGYSGAALAWRTQARIDQANAYLEANDAAQLSTLDSRKGSQQLEQLYGKTGVVAAGWMEWAEGLTRGKGLAKTLVVLSSAAAIGCFIAAGRRTS
jgi:hypothetical protein